MISNSYPREFRAEAVKLVLEQELTHGEAASRLGIPKGTLANWMAAAMAGSEKPAPGAVHAAPCRDANRRGAGL
ncbi:transposase [Azotobacter chroococcum]|uniref:transposase n=1 Tax=Azotobacter chroococcum TaxID=353 RepID=UPI0010ADE782|nr:hypothetical protein FCG41_03840 [Azotobacter chroococcum]